MKMDNGVWRTVGGRRVFIKEGQDVKTAMKESGKFDKKIPKFEVGDSVFIEGDKRLLMVMGETGDKVKLKHLTSKEVLTADKKKIKEVFKL